MSSTYSLVSQSNESFEEKYIGKILNKEEIEKEKMKIMKYFEDNLKCKKEECLRIHIFECAQELLDKDQNLSIVLDDTMKNFEYKKGNPHKIYILNGDKKIFTLTYEEKKMKNYYIHKNICMIDYENVKRIYNSKKEIINI